MMYCHSVLTYDPDNLEQSRGFMNLSPFNKARKDSVPENILNSSQRPSSRSLKSSNKGAITNWDFQKISLFLELSNDNNISH